MVSVFGEELRKLVMVGIGATAMTVEKSKELIEELVEKGELTVELGKSMNDELKHSIKKTLNNESQLIKMDELESLDEDQLEELRKNLAALDDKKSDKVTKKDEKK